LHAELCDLSYKDASSFDTDSVYSGASGVIVRNSFVIEQYYPVFPSLGRRVVSHLVGRWENWRANRISQGKPNHSENYHSSPGRWKAQSRQGINLPDTSLQLSAITPKDLVDLKFVAKHADIVELSFANSADDVRRLQHELKRLGAKSGLP
jgi:hypothetical protein